jgi:Rrf2 family protein
LRLDDCSLRIYYHSGRNLGENSLKLSTRSRYGLRAAVELAAQYGKGPLQIRVIARRQQISAKYLEQLVAVLKLAGLVRSVRGPKGGYLLARPPAQISLYDVLKVLEGAVCIVECLEHESLCPREPQCLTRPLWDEVNKAIVRVLQSTSLQDLLDKSRIILAGGTGGPGCACPRGLPDKIVGGFSR